MALKSSFEERSWLPTATQKPKLVLVLSVLMAGGRLVWKVIAKCCASSAVQGVGSGSRWGTEATGEGRAPLLMAPVRDGPWAQPHDSAVLGSVWG